MFSLCFHILQFFRHGMTLASNEAEFGYIFLISKVLMKVGKFEFQGTKPPRFFPRSAAIKHSH